jgi:hypothetical protein
MQYCNNKLFNCFFFQVKKPIKQSPERLTLHGRPIIENCVVCDITEVMPNGVALFEDPIEGDHNLYPGSYVQWPKAYIHSKVCRI